MLPWNQRSFEIANLLNPAFCSLLLYDAIQAYYKKKGQGMPYALSFLILPVVLHKQTRETLPKSTVAQLHPWLQNNGQVCVGFSQRVRYLVPYTREAMIFGMQTNLITLDERGELVPGRSKIASLAWETDSEADECRAKAKFIGSWYSNIQDVSSLYIMWGVRP